MTMTYTYDPQGNVTSTTDPSGNTTIFGNVNGVNGYNIANQPVQVLSPATRESGPGHVDTVTNYLYPGGPAVSTQIYDESGALIREVDTHYGQEGETLSVSGSTEPVSYTYDAQGYLATVSYPGSDTGSRTTAKCLASL